MTEKEVVGRKDDQGKLRWALLFPWKAAKGVMKVLEFGALKYSPNNWKTLSDLENRYLNAALRHIIDDIEGERLDDESGLDSLDHAICDLMFVQQYRKEAELERKNLEKAQIQR